MNLDLLRRDIEYRTRQIGRQKRDIAKLRALGIDTSSAEELLARMAAGLEQLRAQRTSRGRTPAPRKSSAARNDGMDV